jgi:hypothetical protein
MSGQLETELAAKEAPRSFRPISLVLAAAILLGAGFGLGATVTRHSGETSSSSQFPAGFPSTLPSGAPQGGGFGGGAGGAVTLGTVERISGDTVYIRTSDGSTVKVVTNGSTAVSIVESGSVSDLSPGQSVTVFGSKSGGSVRASRITEGDAGFPGGPGSSSSGSNG